MNLDFASGVPKPTTDTGCFRLAWAMCSFNPLLKLTMHRTEFTKVQTINRPAIVENKVKDTRYDDNPSLLSELFIRLRDLMIVARIPLMQH